jgi:hypothetical protein
MGCTLLCSGLRGQTPDGVRKCQFIALSAQAANHADCQIRKIRMLAEGFAGVDVGQVNFYEWHLHPEMASRRATLVWVKAAGLMMMNDVPSVMQA